MSTRLRDRRPTSSAPRPGRARGWRFVPVLAVLMLLAGTGGAQADQPQLTVRVEPPSGEVGLVMQLYVSINGAGGADCNLIETPAVEGGRLELAAGPNSANTTVYVNGRSQRSMRTDWRFQLVPERAGTLSIPPLRFNCRGDEIRTSPVSVSVGPSTLRPGTVGLELHASTDSLWAGQVVMLEIQASIDAVSADKLAKGGLELELPWLEGVPGLLRLDTPPPTGQIIPVRLVGSRDAFEMRGSRDVTRNRIVLTRTINMLATAAGTIELPASRFSATLVLETGPDRSDPFAGFFGGALVATRAAVVDARAAGPVLEVRAPPLEGRPASFTNAVGRFKFTGTAAPATLRVGDSCTLTLTLTGDGNLDFLDWPAFEELSTDFRIYGKSERKLPRTRVLEIQISPKTAEVTEVPALEFSAFEPEQGVYEVLTVSPFELSVSPGGEDGLIDLRGATETLASLETIRETLPDAAGGRVPAWLLWVPAALLLLAVDVRARRASWRERNPNLLRARGARPALQAALAEAEGAHDVCAAFAHFLAARLDGPPAGLLAEEAAARLDDEALAGELRQTWSRWEASALGGAPFDLARARAEALRLADRVEAAT